MIQVAWNNRRRVVPRWRPLSAALQSGELAAPKKIEKGDHSLSPELQKRLARWRGDPSIVTAAELVEAAIVEGKETEGVKAAKLLSRIDIRATPLIKDQANLLLVKAGRSKAWEVKASSPAEQIHIWRTRTREHPRDALAWVELAFYQTILGDADRAQRAMSTALGLAPNNRHVVRSAGRLFLHSQDFDRAHDVVRRSESTKFDPWLLSAEITLAEIAGRSSRLVKVGTRMLESDDFRPRHISELASAVATLEMTAGSRKKAKRSFHQSLVDPTGNSQAQAEWAAPNFDENIVPVVAKNDSPDFAEAMAFHRFREWKFPEVVQFCEMWAEEEPYSIRPFEFSSAAAAFSGDYPKAIELAQKGLKLRPNASRLGNSRVFALASVNRIEEAETALNDIKYEDGEQVSQLVGTANRALIAFRRGDHERGASLYADAISGFKKIGDARSEASARIYYAREARRVLYPGHESIVADAKEAWEKLHKRPHPVFQHGSDTQAGLFEGNDADERPLSFSLTHRVTL